MRKLTLRVDPLAAHTCVSVGLPRGRLADEDELECAVESPGIVADAVLLLPNSTSAAVLVFVAESRRQHRIVQRTRSDRALAVDSRYRRG